MMKRNIKTYISLGFVILIALIIIFLAKFTTQEKFIQGIVSFPIACALVSCIFQILRDQFNYEKEKELQEKQNLFNIGITSHMAQVAFDKHVEFCEQYMEEVHLIVEMMYQEGPYNITSEHIDKFFKLRRKYSTWITDSIASKLDLFENALGEIKIRIEMSSSTNNSSQRDKLMNEALEIFGDILFEERDKEEKINKKILAKKLKKEIRKTLGVEELTELRDKVIRQGTKLL